MNKNDRIYELIELLNYYNKLYDEGCPAISDKEYDDLYFELETLEKETGLIFNNSPTQKIDYQVVNKLNKVTHNHPMLSLAKTKSIDEVKNFIGNHQSIVMAKMDGLTCSLRYMNGELVGAETRGNGEVGEDILHNIKFVKGVPVKINFKEELIIDGEVICTYKDFEEFSSAYKNPRNFASGSIRLLDSKESAKRKLTFVAWDCIKGLDCATLNEKIIYMTNDLGFIVVPWLLVDKNSDLEHIQILIKDWAKEENYPIDGLVFKWDNCADYAAAGLTGHHPKGGLAFKFYDEEYETHLLNIEYTMGRTGTLTPVAVFEPVEFDDASVERASLHNLNIMKQTLGEPYYCQKINVFKANLIIPQVASGEPAGAVTTGFKNREISQMLPYPDFFAIPKECPICGGQLSIIDDTFLTCTNAECDGQFINKLDHYVSKKGLDIKGLSKATLEKLINWGWVNNLTDLYCLNDYYNEWIKKPGFGKKSVDNILTAIEQSKTCELWQFLSALGIYLVGTTYAKEIAKQCAGWLQFMECVNPHMLSDRYDFTQWDGFGPEINTALHSFDYTEANEIVDKYLNLQNSLFNKVIEDNSLVDKTFVITGKVETVKNRDELKALIESHGGKVASAVSKNTSYLINNDINSSSSKNLKAKQLNIPIITEAQLLDMI